MQVVIKQLFHIVILFSLLLASQISLAAANAVPLAADQAFEFSVSMKQDKQIVANWHIAPGYYLYRDRFDVILNNDKSENVIYPQGDFKYDSQRGRYEALSGDINVIIPVPETPAKGKLSITYQGCSQDGFCYPPMQKNLQYDLTLNIVKEDNSQTLPSLHGLETQQSSIQHLLATQHLLIQLLILTALGVLLAFTPCVLPMIPILTSIIVGQKKVTTKKAFFLSLTYVLGTAITYAIAGVIAASMGSSLQVWLQQPWVIAAVCGIFIMLALSLFGLFDLRLPAAIQTKLINLENEQKSGTYAGVFIMGMISTLIISPCVTAPLVGVLLYIAQTGNLALGAGALFMLGMGMGLPLLLVGITAGKWLPKSGAWMLIVKQLFGFLMLAMAIWLSTRILTPVTIKLLTAALLLAIAAFLMFYLPRIMGQHLLNRAMGITVMACGLMLMAGGKHLPNTVNNWFGGIKVPAPMTYTLVKNIDDLNRQIAMAEAANKNVILDFYADWCNSCIQMEKNVFNQPSVKAALKNYVLLRADLSGNTTEDEKLLKHLNVIAPPTVLFFSPNGKEMNSERIVGEVNANEFLSRLNKLESCQTKRMLC